MKLNQANARRSLPKHKLVFNEHTIEVYSKVYGNADLEMVATILVQKAGAVIRLKLPNGRWNTFAKVISYPGTAAVKRALLAERSFEGNNRAVTAKQIDAAFEKANVSDIVCCLDILSQHFDKGVHPSYWPFLTKSAKATFNYTGTKKPVGEAFMTPVQKQNAARLSIKRVAPKADESAPAKPERKPRVMISEGQALLRAAGATFDANGKMSTSADAKPARKPRTSKAQASGINGWSKAIRELHGPDDSPKPARATKAEKLAPIQGTWSKDDDAALEGLLDDIANATARLAHLNNARKQGISIAAYDKATKPKTARQTKK